MHPVAWILGGVLAAALLADDGEPDTPPDPKPKRRRRPKPAPEPAPEPKPKPKIYKPAPKEDAPNGGPAGERETDDGGLPEPATDGTDPADPEPAEDDDDDSVPPVPEPAEQDDNGSGETEE